MMNKRKIAAMTLTGALTAGAVFAPVTETKAESRAEYSKNENVYVRMDSEGDVSGTYVVNAFTVKEAGDITDYGDYESIQNLTNLDGIEEDKEEYTFYAEKGKFYYQGNIEDAQLPWDFEITYILDGKEVDAEELAGAEGDLEIHMAIRENPAAANPAFYQAYLLQISFNLDNKLCEDIVAKGASLADAGADQQITFTVMPDTAAQAADSGQAETQDSQAAGKESQDGQPADAGQEEAANQETEGKATELVITATVTDFEMGDISINGAAMTDFPVSFVSGENQDIVQTMFIMSAEGISIPEEPEAVEPVEEDNRNFIQKLIDKILNHKEG